MPTPMKPVLNLPSAVVEEEGSANSTAANNSGEEAWICSCAKLWPTTQKHCGNAECHKCREGKRDGSVDHRSNASSSSSNMDGAPLASNNIAKKDHQPSDDVPTENINNVSCWTCHNCQHVMAAKKQRCGKCHHWKGGKRTLWKKKKTDTNDDDYGDDTAAGGVGAVGGDVASSNDIAVNNNAAANANKNDGVGTVHKARSYPYDITQEWTCANCSITLPAKQTRCGKCHGWRGGKRRGGWKLNAKNKNNNEEEEDGIDRKVNWTCCNVVLPARQTRCGKCHKWRGGKRVFSGNNGGESKNKKRVKSESDKKEVKVVSNDRLKETDRAEASGVQHHPLLLANDKAEVVFEYPMPSASAASIAAESYHPLPSPIASCEAAVVTNSAEMAEI
eukprot:scaffold1550_cov74-Skeletonema_menzelii.AAC.2